MNLQLITGPAVEPVSLTVAKNFLVLDASFTQDDGLVSALITAARQYAENYTHRAFFNQQWRLSLNNFPVWWPEHGTVSPASRTEYLLGTYWMKQSAILLPNPTCVSVDSITYVDTTNTEQTLASSAYYVDTTAEPAIVVPVPGRYWPTTQAMLPGSVQVLFTGGSYGDGVEVNTCPSTVTTAIQLLVSHWYANREASSAVSVKSIPFGVDVLLDTITVHCMDYNSH
jgi:uncharacterized phiE125 gp8 family phage protein